MLSRYALLTVLIVPLTFFLLLKGYETCAQPIESKPDKGAAKKSADAPNPLSPKEAAPADTCSPPSPPGKSHPLSTPSPVPKPLSVTPPITPSPTAPPPSPKSLKVPFSPKPISPPPGIGKPVQPPPDTSK